MWQGELISIYITDQAGEPLRAIQEVHAEPGVGLIGDRYHHKSGSYASQWDPGREVTLIESEALEALANEAAIQLAPGAHRRNLVTRSVPLNHLVGKTFRVGQVTLRGVRLCEPCNHLENLTFSGVRAALVHRGGLRAQILTAGTIRAGDEIKAQPESTP